MARETFIFYRDWLNALNDMPDNVQLEIYKSIATYALDGNLSELSQLAKIAFSFVKPQIDRDIEKYNKVVERNRLNGKSGGRKPKQKKENPKNPLGYLETQKTQTNPKNLDNDNDNDNINDNKEISTNVDIKKEKTNFDKFNVWIKENTPNVMKLSNQMTEEQFNKARSKYDFEQMSHILLQMENYKGLTKKYTSVYLTFINWAKKEYGNK